MLGMSGTTLRLGLIIAIANAIMTAFIVNSFYPNPNAYLSAAFAVLLLCFFGIPRVKQALSADHHPRFNTGLLAAAVYLPAFISLILLFGDFEWHQPVGALFVGTLFFYLILKDHDEPEDETESSVQE